MLWHAADKSGGDKAGPVLFALPCRNHARGKQPAIERAHRCGICIDINAAMLEQDFVAHEVADTVPTAAIAVDLDLPFAAPRNAVELCVAPQSKIP